MVHNIVATGHRGEVVQVAVPRSRLQEIMRDAIWNSAVSSSEMEGIDLSDMKPPKANTIPDELLSIP